MKSILFMGLEDIVWVIQF